MQKTVNAKRAILLAGVAGGTVEVVWVLLFCMVAPLQSSLVAEEIARSFFPQMAGIPAVTAGIIIHYVLALLIAGVAAMTLFRILGRKSEVRTLVAASVAALVAIWITNFFVILPVVNPGFVTLMPYTVTLVSKVGFGVAMGWVYGVRICASAGDAQQMTGGRLALR
jgi:hypothetical protein